MKLYTAPGTCSIACTIALHEAGVEHTLIKTDISAHKTATGEDFYAINPKGSVPALDIGGGEVLTEGVAIQQFVADSAPQAGLVPEQGTMERARMHEAMHFIGSGLHVAYAPLFYMKDPDEKAKQLALVDKKLGWLEGRLSDGREWLAGASFTLADSYMLAISNFSAYFGHSLAAFPKLEALRARVMARPAVQAAIAAEKAL